MPQSCAGTAAGPYWLEQHIRHPQRRTRQHPPAPPSAAGLRLRYLEWGPSGSSEVVLLLHDLGEAADIWRRIGARLAQRGYRVLAVDLRGGHTLVS